MNDATELALVETIVMYRMRYVVAVPIGKSEWAGDTVVMNEATEFSQECLGETVSSIRVIGKDECIDMFNHDNGYLKDLSEEDKLKNFVTQLTE
jgi:hypothetical protein